MRHRRAAMVIVTTATVAATAASSPAASPAVAPATAPTAGPAVTYTAPVPVRVLRRFEPPARPYGPGHRGVDLAAAPGATVRAAGTGRVSFAGAVAGRGVVVIIHADGVRTEYEPVRASARVGALVRSGDTIGTISGHHAACAPASCLHWGARRGEVYLDPLLLLRPLGPVRLLP